MLRHNRIEEKHRNTNVKTYFQVGFFYRAKNLTK